MTHPFMHRYPTRRGASLLTTALILVVAEGCFSPNAKSNQDGDGTETSGSTGSSMSDASTAAMMTSLGTSADSTSTGPSSDATAADSDGSDDAASPFCGDGTIDDTEECDDGEDNGPGQACLANCQVNVCGDGDPGPGEVCDDGASNALELGACAPDCSTIIEAKEIVLAVAVSDGNLGQNPVATVDGLCEPGYRALFAHTGVREFEPLTDWPLRPYTAYHNGAGSLVWLTDATPALGVRDGDLQALQTAIGSSNGLRVVTGLHADWSTRVTKTCNGWSSSSPTYTAARGNQTSTTDFLDHGIAELSCDELSGSTCPAPGNCVPFFTAVYCVEQ